MRLRHLAMEVEVRPMREDRLVAVGDHVLGQHRITRGNDDATTQLDVFVRPPNHRLSVPEARDPAPELFERGRQQLRVVEQPCQRSRCAIKVHTVEPSWAAVVSKPPRNNVMERLTSSSSLNRSSSSRACT